MAAKCGACGELFVPPRPLCPKCFGEAMEWVEISGKGKLAAFTTIYIGPGAMVAAGYNRNSPYTTGIVELDEGPLISAQILGLDTVPPSISHIGTPLTVSFIERGQEGEERTFLAFAV